MQTQSNHRNKFGPQWRVEVSAPSRVKRCEVDPIIGNFRSEAGREVLERCRIASLVGSTDCWRWPGTVRKDGYGVILVEFRPYPIHRLSFQLYKGIIPPKFEVMHDCDFRRCWNPDHLVLGTHAENMQDMIRKGRAGWQRKEREQAAVERCKSIQTLRKPYGYPGEVIRTRCIFEIGHIDGCFFNL